MRYSAARWHDLENLARDYHALNLAGSLADGAELYIAIVLLRRIVLDKAVAAVQLHRLIADAHRHFARVEFRHRRLASHTLARVFEHRGPQCQQSRRIKLGSHVGQLPLHALKFSDGLPELPALLHVSQTRLKRTARNAQRQCSY